MGFLDLAKHGIKMRIKYLTNLVSKKRIVEREKSKRREEEEEEEKKRRREEDEGEKFKQSQIKVWKLTLVMDSMRFGVDLWFCMVILLPQT